MKILKTIAVVLTLVITNLISAQGKFYVNSYLQYVSGKTDDGAGYSNVFFYNGIKYQTRDLYLSLNFPFVMVNQVASNNQTGGINNRPSGGSVESNADNYNTKFGVGDLYFNLSYRIVSEQSALPSLSLDGYLKAPTATESLGIGSGSFDYFMALGLQKSLDRFMIFTQFGYLILGKIAGNTVDNPITLSVGIGYLLGSNNQSVYLGYDSYSTIIQGHEPPKQISLGYSRYLNSGVIFNAIVSLPLNSATSDYFFGGGINYEI